MDIQQGLVLDESTREHISANMLPKDTQFLEVMRDELELFGERLYREIIRILRENYP